MILTACLITCNDLAPLKACLNSLKGFVDDIVIGVDRKDQDGTFEWLTHEGYHPYHFDFNGFGAARSETLARCKTPWAFIIDSDELILPQDAQHLRKLCEEGTDVDCYKMHRKFWYDLDMTQPSHENAAPVCRLIKTHCRYEGNVHENLLGAERSKLTDLSVHSFNLYYYPVGSPRWKKKQELYGSLGCRTSQENFLRAKHK
jgi:hypothetical protein